MMGTETTFGAEFQKVGVTFTIKEVPGPDRLEPYQVIIHDKYLENRSGIIDGTKYEIAWKAVPSELK